MRLRNRKIRLLPAIVASWVGSAAFGVLMTLMDMMPMVGALVGSETVGIGWLVHMAIGTLFGGAFAIVGAFVPTPNWLLGFAFGIGMWVVAAQVVMPLWLGMPGMVFHLGSSMPWYSLMGHAIYGLALGLGYGIATGTGATSPARTAST